VLSICIQVLTILTYLGTLAAAGWGFILAHRLFDSRAVNGNVNEFFGLSTSTMAYFTGLMAFYYILFSILGLASEIRTDCIKKTCLRQFGFMKSFFGRGCFLIFIGTIFITIPWDEQQKWISKVPAGLQLAMGFFQLIISFATRESRNFDVEVHDPTSTKANVKDSAKIQWGAPESYAKDDSSSESATASRVAMMKGEHSSTNLVLKESNSATASELPSSGTTVSNPFMQAMSASK
jgi:COPI associated protein